VISSELAKQALFGMGAKSKIEKMLVEAFAGLAEGKAGKKTVKNIAKRVAGDVFKVSKGDKMKLPGFYKLVGLGALSAGVGIGSGAVIQATRKEAMDKTAAMEMIRQQLFWTKVAEYIEKKAGPMGAIRGAGSSALGFSRSILGGGASKSVFEKMLAATRAEKAALGGGDALARGLKAFRKGQGSPVLSAKLDALVAEAKAKGLNRAQVSDLLSVWMGGTPITESTPYSREILDAWAKTIGRRQRGAAIGGGAALLGGGGAAIGLSNKD
jgi:hypothetical protein